MGLSVVTECGGLNGGDLETSSKFIEDQSGQSFTFNVVNDEDQRSVLLGDEFEDVQDRLEVGELLVADEDISVFEFSLLGLGVGDEIRRDISSVESETFNEFDFVVKGLTVLDGDGSVFTDSVHEFSDEVTDFGVTVGGDGGNGGNSVLTLNRSGSFLQVLEDVVNGQIYTSSQIHGVHAGSDALATFLEDGSSEDGGGGGTITSFVVGLVGDVLNEGSTEVHVSVSEFDILGDGDTILGDLRSTEGLVNDDISTFRAEGDLDGISESFATFEHLLSAESTENDVLAGERSRGKIVQSFGLLSSNLGEDFFTKREHA